MSYAWYDEDPWADVEAIEAERADVDAELAEMNAAADALYAAEKRGICPHWSLQGFTCVRCGRVFGSDGEWAAAQDAIASGDDEAVRGR